MIVKMADDHKRFLALLNGIARRNYYGHSELTDDVLKEEIYPDISQDDFSRISSRTLGLVKSLVSADMDMTQLEIFLTAQMSRKDGALTEDQAGALRKFWKANKLKVHDSIVSQTMWGNILQKISWRVDLKSQSRAMEQINAPTAIVELHIAENQNKTKESEVVRFELDEVKVTDLLHTMKEIDTQINSYIKT